ncbi:MAG: plasmid stabilization protein [Candidatus Marinimicrobia bacterium CG_4_9_14_3_um_filter_48_9]|nr:MAG: plasmid stabilization protein [Candidatus Marinimicrobia bacterium CG_4_9_14_3_um_filter_48_9]
MKSIRFLSIASQELIDAATYYDEQAQGLGEKFLNRVQSAVAQLELQPEVWPLINSNIHRMLIRQFPFALLYRIEENEVIVLAVMHLKREPKYWVNRCQ